MNSNTEKDCGLRAAAFFSLTIALFICGHGEIGKLFQSYPHLEVTPHFERVNKKMFDSESVQDREINPVADAPLTDRLAGHRTGLHILIENTECHVIPIGVFSRDDRIIQILDEKVKTSKAFFTEPQDFVDSFHDPPFAEIMHGPTAPTRYSESVHIRYIVTAIFQYTFSVTLKTADAYRQLDILRKFYETTKKDRHLTCLYSVWTETPVGFRLQIR